jgi:hypothetical protein
MRRLLGITFLAIALVVGNFTLGSANASNNDDGDVIRLVTRPVVAETLDLGAAGDSVGDQEVFSDNVFADGARVGTLDGTCTATRVTAAGLTLHCTVTLTLPDGQITNQGSIQFDADFDGTFYIAITGGTGDFNEAQGQVKVQFVTDNKTRLTVLLD